MPSRKEPVSTLPQCLIIIRLPALIIRNHMRPFIVLSCLTTLILGNPASADPISFSVEPVFVHEDNHDLRRIGELEFISGISVTSEDKRFGGLSDLAVGPGGKFLAITDKGHRVTSRLRHNLQGKLAGLSNGNIKKLQTTKGNRLKGKKKSDAEGLTRTKGGWLVSFEHKHRIWFYEGADPAKTAAKKIPLPKGLKDMPDNGGLESLVELDDGRLLTFSEDLETDRGHTRGWLRTDGDWALLSLTRSEDFAPTGMTRLATGDILVLERSFTMLKGPAARIRLIKKDKIVPNAVLQGREIARLSGQQTVDNMEGISAVMMPGGEHIFLVSDDNFNPLQRNLIFEFRFAD
jgi:hypothetical protein